MSNNQSRIFGQPLSNGGSYRYNPSRAIPPRVLAAPRFHAILSGKIPIPSESTKEFENCLDKLSRLFPIVNTGFMGGGHGVGGGFWIHTIWSDNPRVADVVIVRGPGDVGYFGLPYFYEQSRDESLLQDLIPIDLPYVS